MAAINSSFLWVQASPPGEEESTFPLPWIWFVMVYLLRVICLYFWLRWVFVAAHGLSLVAVSGGYSSLPCIVFSLQQVLLLRSTVSIRKGFSSCSVVVVHGLRRSLRQCGIPPVQGSYLCPLHWQAGSYPLHHQGSPVIVLNNKT